MKRRSFSYNTFAISIMYDTVLFIVMVSLAGVILLPVMQTHSATESLIDKHREDVVDDGLHTYLVSRPDLFNYRFCGSLLDTIAGHLGINTSSHGLYKTISEWILAHEQRHKTYATLLTENLGCQFMIPFSFLGQNRMNILTQEYDIQLRNQTEQFFLHLFEEKYHYNLTAWWHPIKGISFGGEFCLGESPPINDCYVSQSICRMPFTPVLSIENTTIILTEEWLKNHFFNATGNSSIPFINNILYVFNKYKLAEPPYQTRENASYSIKENLSSLVFGFLIEGITNETNNTVFPGLVHLILTSGFEKLRQFTIEMFDTTLENLFGGAVESIDKVFGSLNSSSSNPLSQLIFSTLNSSLHGLLNESFPSFNNALDACEQRIKNQITLLISTYLDGLADICVQNLFMFYDGIDDIVRMIGDWLFDQLCLDTAEVMLTIWVVRE
jgi:hypothetical protein